MAIVIIWSNFAKKCLKEIFDYYKEKAGEGIAENLKITIFESTKQLKNHPESGQIEEALMGLNQGHRYLVVGNYKIIYKPVQEGFFITDIFDCRQDPIKMNVESR